MKRLIIIAMLLVGIAAPAQNQAKWLRYVAISPDASNIAFCYKGDIFVVPTSGGQARQLTFNPAYDFAPVWSPDGRRIAFASDRYGNFDIYVVSTEGGAPRRITTHSTREVPHAFSPDGKHIVYEANIQAPAASAFWRSYSQLYRISVDGGRPEPIFAVPAEESTFSPDGRYIYYDDVKGNENRWRKHHTSSVVKDIWQFDTSTGKHRRLTSTVAESRNAAVSPDGKQIYFLAERNGGSFNVYSMPVDNPSDERRLTSFKRNPVRFLTIARNGTLCYTFEGEIYTQSVDGKPHRIDVDVVADYAAADRQQLRLSRDASQVEISPDGKQMAMVIRGDVFVTSAEYTTTKRITATAEQERSVSFSPDSRTLLYTGEREGRWNIYTAHVSDDKATDFANAALVEEKCIYHASKGAGAFAPKFSPDGKKIAFFDDRRYVTVVDVATGKAQRIDNGDTIFSTTDSGMELAWSPDSEWLTLTHTPYKHWPYDVIGLLKADGSQPVHSIVASGYSCSSPRFVMGGKAVLFLSDRYGMRSHASWGSLDDAFLVFLTQKAYDEFRLSKEEAELAKEYAVKSDTTKTKTAVSEGSATARKGATAKVESVEIELDGIEDRVVRLTVNSSNMASAVLTDDGEKLYYLSSFEGNYDLWCNELRKRKTSLVQKLDSRWGELSLSGDQKTLYVNSTSAPMKYNIAASKREPIAYDARFTVDMPAERACLFDHIVEQVRYKLFDASLFGVDWDYYAAFYRRFLPYINNNYDFSELASELLGELNVSHTGCRYYPSTGGDATAELGLLFDWNHTGDGLLVDEVVEGSQLDKADSRVKAGMIVEQINGTPIRRGEDYFPLLNLVAGTNIQITVYDPATKERWNQTLKPVSRAAMNDLYYRRWVKNNEQMVERLSGGRLGYVHLRSMNDDSYRTIYSDLLGKYNLKEGVVIDTRYNGGGRLHEDVEVLFSGRKYISQIQRSREACDMPSRRWNRPSIMLTCEANYSNAHGTPYVYSYCHLGSLVGMPVPGTMSSVWWETLPSRDLVFGIPVTGMRTNEGYYLENTQLEPDIKVALVPEEIVAGRDRQVEAAVEELLRQIDGKSSIPQRRW